MKISFTSVGTAPPYRWVLYHRPIAARRRDAKLPPYLAVVTASSDIEELIKDSNGRTITVDNSPIDQP
jgi:hypothetical protein